MYCFKLGYKVYEWGWLAQGDVALSGTNKLPESKILPDLNNPDSTNGRGAAFTYTILKTNTSCGEN